MKRTLPKSLIPATLLLLATVLPSTVLAQPGAASRYTQGIEAYVSNDALQAMYARRMNMGEFGTNDVRVGFFTNHDRDLVLLADVLMNVATSSRFGNWSLQAGSRMFGALLSGPNNEETFAISLGGTLSYYLGRNGATSISVSGFYAPDILAFGSSENIVDTMVRFETHLTASTRFFIGYRSLEFQQRDADRNADDGSHVGVVYRF